MNGNDAEIEAGEWLARLDRGDATPADLSAFDRWRTADVRHASAYARLEATWQALDRIQAVRPGPAEPIHIDYLKSPKGSPAAITHGSSARPLARLSPLHRRALLGAACMLVAAAGAWIARDAMAPHVFTTGVGGFQRIVLEDQSAIDLNTDSEVRVQLSAHLRKVRLVRGEASFEVAHDPSRPFIVSAGNTAVRAVGTRFDVLKVGNSVEVTVDEGKVVLGAPELLETLAVVPPTIQRISAGQTALSSGDGVKLSTLSKDGVARKLAWQNQMLVFDGYPLSDVVAQFNRYNRRQLVIADPRLATLRIGGYFRPTNLDAFVRVLQSDFDVRVTPNGNELSLGAMAAE